MPEVKDQLSTVFAALADPTRRDILARLRTGPLVVGDLAASYSMSRPAVSQHLRVLESAGLLTRTTQSRWRRCELRDEGLAEATEWITTHRAAWEQRFDRLVDHLVAGDTDDRRSMMLDPDKQFTIVRDLPASPDRVWRAWLDPDEMAGWLAVMNASRESISSDARVGGRYAYTMVDPESGREYPTGGEFLELDEPRRLVMSWGNPGDAVDDAPRLTVDLEPIAGGTRMTFTCQGVAGEPGDGDVFDGWVQALDGFVAYLSA